MRKRPGVTKLDVGRLLEALDREQHRRQLTQLQVAGQLGVNPSTIRQWRLGVGMSGDVAVRIALWLAADLRDYAAPPAGR
jgi:transcriptional regulator with XRE-family HTH domain